MESMKNNAVISGSDGTIELPDPWMPEEKACYHAKTITKNGNEEIIDVKGPEHLFFFEGELASQCIAKENTTTSSSNDLGRYIRQFKLLIHGERK